MGLGKSVIVFKIAQKYGVLKTAQNCIRIIILKFGSLQKFGRWMGKFATLLVGEEAMSEQELKIAFKTRIVALNLVPVEDHLGCNRTVSVKEHWYRVKN